MENLQILNYLEKNINNESNDDLYSKKILIEYFYIFVVSEVETKWKKYIYLTIKENGYKSQNKKIISKLSCYFFDVYKSNKNINIKDQISEILGKILLNESIKDSNNQLFLKYINDFLNNKTWNKCNIKNDITILMGNEKLNNKIKKSEILDKSKFTSDDNNNVIWKRILFERNKIVHNIDDFLITEIIPTKEYFDFAKTIFNILNKKILN